jgi:uncharacterized membrane protein
MRATYPQQAQGDHRAMVWAIVAVITSGVAALIFAAPLAQARGNGLFADEVYRFFSHVCHQASERSFHLAGFQLAVCARCTGLYLGIALASCFYPLLRSLKQTDTLPCVWLFAAAAPMAIDFYLDSLSIWHNTQVSRFLTGILLGAATMFYIIPGLLKLSTSYRWRNKIRTERRKRRLKQA